MAVRLLAHDVSDLCLGKPPLRSLPVSATVGEALAALRRCGEPYLSVWTPLPAKPEKKAHPSCVSNVTVVDVICFLCAEANITDPCSALKSPVTALFPKDHADLVRRVESHSSILEAIDLILDGAQNLVVPIRPSPAKKRLQPGGAIDFCRLTQEDFVRFFLNSIGLFSPVPALSIETLGLIRREPFAVRHRDSALSAAPLLKLAAASQTALAVVDDEGRLIGEISPAALAFCAGEAAAGALAALSAGELMAYVDCGQPHRDVVRAVKTRLMEKGLKGMVDLMEDEEDTEEDELAVLLSSSTNSSSEDEETSEGKRSGTAAAAGRRWSRLGSYSSRMGRRSEEAIVCHPGSSLVAVMIQALAHRVSYVWVVEEDYELAGLVVFSDVLRVFREHMCHSPSAAAGAC